LLLRARAESGAARSSDAASAEKVLEEALAKNPLLPARIKLLVDEARKLKQR